MKNKNCFPKATTVRGEGNQYKSEIEAVARSIFFSLTYQKHGELSSNQTGKHCPSQAPS